MCTFCGRGEQCVKVGENLQYLQKRRRSKIHSPLCYYGCLLYLAAAWLSYFPKQQKHLFLQPDWQSALETGLWTPERDKGLLMDHWGRGGDNESCWGHISRWLLVDWNTFNKLMCWGILKWQISHVPLVLKNSVMLVLSICWQSLPPSYFFLNQRISNQINKHPGRGCGLY